MLKLRVVPPSGEPFEQPLEGEELAIGRASDCDLVIADRFLSRRHARIFRVADEWRVEDLGSRNGTQLNGRKIEHAERLREGDEIRLSGTVVSLVAARPQAPPRTTSADDRGSDISEHTILRRASDLMETESGGDPARALPEDVRRYTERLQMLNRVHQALSSPIELDALLDMILVRAFEHLGPEEGVIYLRSPEGEYYRAASHSIQADQSDYLYSETLVRQVAEQGMAALVLDVESDERFAEAQSILASGVRSLVAAPLLDASGSLGMIALNSRANKRQFAEDDMELLVSLASVAAMRIRNVALAAEAAERRRLEEEMRLARQIQVRLLPDKLPEVLGYALHGGNIPSRGVSGDYYEIVERGDAAECVLMIADVSGKGIAASILTASLEALSAGPIESGMDPDEICTQVSRRLFRRTAAAKYATALLAVLNRADGRVRYANAGHNPALLVRRDGTIDELGPTGMPLGLLADSGYTADETSLEPGDTLVLYTDGITEATDPEEEEYGKDRLARVCLECREKELKLLNAEIERDLERFARGVPFADDRTVVLLRRLAG